MKTVGIVIPAYNEKENILKLIKGIRKYINCIILIVDDSKDKDIKKILSENKIKNIKYYNRRKKSGRGSAVIFGFKRLIKKQKISCFIEMDADLSHSPAELVRNISFFYKHSLDLLIGSRYLKESKIINILDAKVSTHHFFYAKDVEI